MLKLQKMYLLKSAYHTVFIPIEAKLEYIFLATDVIPPLKEAYTNGTVMTPEIKTRGDFTSAA